MTTQWAPSRLGNLSGKRIIVTGATNGVGLATARALARAGAHVILAVRNLDLGAQRAAEIGGDTAVVKLDLADQSSVRAFPELFEGDVDILINNAGAVVQSRSETVDGFEITMGTNFLGPFALTNLLFDRVRSKIINVGSNAHKTSSIAFDDPHLRSRKWSAFPAYGRSKLAVMLWGLELDRRLREAGSPVTTFLTHPGWVASTCPTSPTKCSCRRFTRWSREWPACSRTTSMRAPRPRCTASPNRSRRAATWVSTPGSD